MRILTLTTLFPNAVQPTHGVFVENRLRHLVADGGVSAEVVAPVPWFPSQRPVFGRYAALARVPPVERRHGLTVHHPRYLSLPKIGMSSAPALLYLGLRKFFRTAGIGRDDFDLVDAHYFYPDGVAAALLARDFGKPLTITARGTDLNLIPSYALPRRQILWAARRADGLITVSASLAERLQSLGIPRERVTVLRNGVDLSLFRPQDGTTLRRKLGLPAESRLLLFVGNLVALKGHSIVIEALRDLPGCTLAIVGDGPERSSLETLAGTQGVSERVRFVGRVGHDELPAYYSAADALLLASSREGWPNVLLEAMACGTPVVATAVGGAPEVVGERDAGVLVKNRTAAAFVDAVRDLLAHPPERASTRRYAEDFSWAATSRGQRELFAAIVSKGSLV